MRYKASSTHLRSSAWGKLKTKRGMPTSKRRELELLRARCKGPSCTFRTIRTRRKVCSKTNIKTELRRRRKWFMSMNLRHNSSRSLKSSSSRNCRIHKRRRERPTRSSKRPCLKLVGAREKDSAKLVALPSLNYLASINEDSQEQQEAKWVQLTAFPKGVEVNPWTPQWGTPIELATREQALEAVSKMLSLEATIMLGLAMPPTVWASLPIIDFE